MIKKANPGLARRFQMADAFEFQDYNDEDLLVILKKRLDQEHILHTLDTLRAGVQIVAQERMKPNFGNAGAVKNMLSRAIQNMEQHGTAPFQPFCTGSGTRSTRF